MHIFYRPEQSIAGLSSYSPSAAKPAAFVEFINKDQRHTLHRFEPIVKRGLYLAHTTQYVDLVFEGVEPNGFDNFDPRVPTSTLYTVGSLVAACLARPTLKGSICSPTSGFHHAGHDFGGGFCTFNGLMVAAIKYLDAHPGSTVGILDCDVHFGNGTADILSKLPEYAKRIQHFTVGKENFGDDDGLGFFPWLKKAIRSLQSCDLVIYQAGADQALGDPLGGYLGMVEYSLRDQTVFSTLGDKIVWNLAGGYQKDAQGGISKVLHLHSITARYSERNYEPEPDIQRT